MSGKIETQIGNAHRLLAPRIAYIVTTISRQGKTNAAPISNVTSVSTQPEAIIMAMVPEWTSFANIKQTREFVINLPGQNLLNEVWICGDKYAGNPIPAELNKITIARLTEIPGIKVRSPRLAECYAHLECKVVWIRNIGGDHALILADIVAVSHDEDAFLMGTRLNVERVKPIMQITGPHFCLPNGGITVDEDRIRAVVQTRIKEARSV